MGESTTERDPVLKKRSFWKKMQQERVTIRLIDRAIVRLIDAQQLLDRGQLLQDGSKGKTKSDVTVHMTYLCAIKSIAGFSTRVL